jgi:hypothetical protein
MTVGEVTKPGRRPSPGDGREVGPFRKEVIQCRVINIRLL